MLINKMSDKELLELLASRVKRYAEWMMTSLKAESGNSCMSECMREEHTRAIVTVLKALEKHSPVDQS